MRLIFLPKHQRLVNQCYPSGSTTDKKPKSSETSYLIYYVNSRRSKLEKVSSFLVKKTTADLNRRRVGNVAVTLEIMDKIINNCKENLNVFIKDFFHIMLNILSNKNFNNDYSIIEMLEMTFGSICATVDDSLLNGDIEFIRNYSKFIDTFFQVVRDKIRKDELLLKCCNDISITSSLASNSQINHYIGKAVHFTLVQFQDKNPKFKEENLDTSSQSPNLARRLSKNVTRPMGFDIENIDENDLSLKVLQSFFNTTETDKLSASIRTFLDCLQVTPNQDLLAFICNKIPVQLRYIVVLMLVRQLSMKASGEYVKSYDPIKTLKLISCLLTSNVSIVGLSVLDIMKKVLQFQMDHIDDLTIANQCCHTIKDLGYKTYYKGQTFDILYEILIRLRATVEVETSKRKFLTRNIEEIIKYKNQPCITLELFVELASYLKNSIFQLFDLVDNQQPTSQIFPKLFKTIEYIDDKGLQNIFMQKIFEKYQKYALLGGLNYYLEETKEPNSIYYDYHTESANFLNLGDYKNQAKYKKDNSLLFSKEDLLNFYSDNGSNQYSAAGSQILMPTINGGSVTDLISDPQITIGFSHPSSEAINIAGYDVANIPFDSLSISKNRELKTPSVSNKGSIYRYVSDDMRSWKTAKANTLKVSDLKNAIKSNKRTSKDDKDKKKTKLTTSLHGSQSVKSRVTNITFLLSELKSSGSHVENIRDPDEEDIVGLDKIHLARSGSVTLRKSLDMDKRRSILNRPNSPLINNSNQDSIEDFEDAEEVVPEMTARGKLFSTT